MPRGARLGPVQAQPPQQRHSLGLPRPGARHRHVARRQGRAWRAPVGSRRSGHVRILPRWRMSDTTERDGGVGYQPGAFNPSSDGEHRVRLASACQPRRYLPVWRCRFTGGAVRARGRG